MNKSIGVYLTDSFIYLYYKLYFFSHCPLNLPHYLFIDRSIIENN